MKGGATALPGTAPGTESFGFRPVVASDLGHDGCMSASGRFAQPFHDYEISGRLGSGGMGTVFRARRKADGLEVAIKVLRPSLSRNKRYVERLRREAEISIRLDHKGLVKGFGFGEEGGYHYIVMEHCPGRTLSALLKAWGRFPEDQVLDLGIQVAEALGYAHAHGIIHRDVKPGNLLIDDEGNAKLTDLGLAKAESDPSLTRHGGTVGTPQYMSPEQAEAPGTVDERSDLYSLGATLYHMLVGMPPFEGESAVQVIAKLLHERAESAGTLNPEVSDGLNLILRRLLMKSPAERYASAAELIRDLVAVREGLAPAIDARALARAEGDAMPAKMRRPRLFVAAASGVILALLAVWTWSLFQDDGSPRPAELGFEKLVEAVGDSERGYRTRFELLASFEPENTGQTLDVQSMRQRLLRSFEDAMTKFHEPWSRERLSSWLDAHRGPNFELDFETEQDLALQRQFRGYRASTLPIEIRSLHADLQSQERDMLRRLRDARIARTVAKAREALENRLSPEISEAVARRDYAAAIQLIDRFIEKPAELAALGVDEATQAWTSVSDDRFESVTQALRVRRTEVLEVAKQQVHARRRVTEEGLDEARRYFRGGFPERALRVLRTLRRRLELAPPWTSLPAQIDPETTALRQQVDRDVRVVESELQRLDLESLALAEDAVHARLARDLDIAAALAMVQDYRFTTREGIESRDALVRDLERVRDLLLDLPRLLGADPKIGDQAPQTWELRDGSVEAEVTHVDPGPPPMFTLRIRGEPLRRVRIHDLDVTWLVRRIERAADYDARRVAVGLLAFYLDEFDLAFRALRSHRLQRLLAARQRREVLLARGARGDEAQAELLLERMRALAARPGPLLLERIARVVEDLTTRLGQTRVVRESEDDIRRTRGLLDRERTRRALGDALPDALRADAIVSWSDADRLQVQLPFGARSAFARGLAPWIKSDAGLRPPSAVGVAPHDELASKLRVDIPVFEPRMACELTLRFVVPATDRPLELLEVEAFGHRFLLVGVLPGGGRALADPPKDLKKALARAVKQKAQPWAFVEGGRTSLTIELGPVEKLTRSARVTQNGQELLTARIDASRVLGAGVQLGVVGDFSLTDILLSGQPR